jgi:methionyl-tRNA synthetase
MPNKNKEELLSHESIIVTSALPYANGEIHLGHIASTYLPADIFTRYSKLTGRETYHICATDDFGTPVLIRAEKENKNPLDYVEFWNRSDYEDFKSLGISFDFFSKTSSEENVKFVQYVFKKLYENGHIYEQEVTQFYCQYDEKFLPDRYVIGMCPLCGADNQYSDLCENCGSIPEQILEPKCSICGKKPIKKDSKHYFFKLSIFSEKLKKWLINNRNLQEDVKKYVLNWIKAGLVDWDITRDLSWGIPIPLQEAKGKVFYGWFDNHLCYISTFATFIQKNYSKKNAKEVWNNSEIYHFIGKDIVYHHYLFLPAIRMAINYEYKLPDFIPTRGHLTLHNRKISKSRNWYIGLKEFLARFNPDYLRFYLSLITPYSQTDINFDWNAFAQNINDELISNIGNLINRVLSFTQKTYGGVVPEPSKYDLIDKGSISEIETIADEVGLFLHRNEQDKGLKRILRFSTYFNRYFQKKQPWNKSDNNNPHTTLFIAVNAVHSLAILLEPFIPRSSERIWQQLGMSNNIHEQSWNYASQLKIVPGHILGKIDPLFRIIEQRKRCYKQDT